MSKLCLILTSTIFLVGAVSTVQLELEPRNAIVLPGQNITILCRAAVPLLSCIMFLPSTIRVSPKTRPTDEYSYHDSGPQYGSCGVTLFNVTDKFNGEVRCAAHTKEELEESIATTNLTVAMRPELGCGAYIAIGSAINFLVIILVLGLTMYARSKKCWCFYKPREGADVSFAAVHPPTEPNDGYLEVSPSVDLTTSRKKEHVAHVDLQVPHYPPPPPREEYDYVYYSWRHPLRGFGKGVRHSKIRS